jgi:hypothetical protein
MKRLPLIYLVVAMLFALDSWLIFAGVCWHLYVDGCGWSSDELHRATATGSTTQAGIIQRTRTTQAA